MEKKGARILAPPRPGTDGQGRHWYLGIDIGTTAISAALLNSQTAQLYPIHWTIATPETRQQQVRLPSVAHFTG
ncbi:MAG: hypothetical protein HC866_23265 [Leptolyngbyaceae cyanobacterium RU_5_1]|nr:hypothetical protein [Leptolyngbyaceae cyanobacterium RU_5_1]